MLVFSVLQVCSKFGMNSCTTSSPALCTQRSRSDEENTFPGQTSPLSCRLVYPFTILLGVSKAPKAQHENSTWSCFQDSLSQSMASSCAQLGKPEAGSQNIIFLRAGTWPGLFSAVSSWPRTEHGTERVLIEFCGITACAHFPPSPPLLFSPGCRNFLPAPLQEPPD